MNLVAQELSPEEKLAQQRVQPRVGVFVNAGYTLHTSNFPGLPETSCCMPHDKAFYTGAGNFGIGGGLLFEYPFNPQFKVMARAGYYTFDVTQTAQAGIGPVSVVKAGENSDRIEEGISEYSLETKLGLVGGEITIGWQPMIDIPLTIKLGPEFGTFIQKTFRQQEELVSPDGYVFKISPTQSSRVRNVVEGTLENMATRIAVVAGASYDLPMNRTETFLLSPEASFSFGATKLRSDDVDWSAHQLRGGVALKYAFPVAEPAPPPPPPPPPPPTTAATATDRAGARRSDQGSGARVRQCRARVGTGTRRGVRQHADARAAQLCLLR